MLTLASNKIHFAISPLIYTRKGKTDTASGSRTELCDKSRTVPSDILPAPALKTQVNHVLVT